MEEPYQPSNHGETTADGSEIHRNQQLRLVPGNLSHYMQLFFLHPNGGCLGFLNHQQYEYKTLPGVGIIVDIMDDHVFHGCKTCICT